MRRTARHLAPIAAIAAASALAAGAASAQDAAAGMATFRQQCGACHQVGPTARPLVGPPLNGLFGRRAASIEGFRYSPAFRALDRVWSEDNFRTYIMSPRQDVPGTIMVYAGLQDTQRIAGLVEFLKQFDSAGQRAP